ncbi:hypothetical protein KSP39_PZI002119 [Platanthera zijinensis]|uniref:Uncharacterized protein n=1 Tax=Platanthera zijinensis TaxID=2320716 RepID=A0AAP0C1J4_9ASPA
MDYVGPTHVMSEGLSCQALSVLRPLTQASSASIPFDDSSSQVLIHRVGIECVEAIRQFIESSVDSSSLASSASRPFDDLLSQVLIRQVGVECVETIRRFIESSFYL